MPSPDLTIPTALEHLRRGIGGVNRYCYQGTAFRYQPRGSGKPEEFTQLGIEIIGETMSDTHQKDANEAEVEQILKIIIAAGVSRFEIVFNDYHILRIRLMNTFLEAFKSQLKRRLLQATVLMTSNKPSRHAQNESLTNPLRMNLRKRIILSGVQVLKSWHRWNVNNKKTRTTPTI